MAMFLSYTSDSYYVKENQEEYDAALQEGYSNGYSAGETEGENGTVWDWLTATSLQKEAMQAAIDANKLNPADVPHYPSN